MSVFRETTLYSGRLPFCGTTSTECPKISNVSSKKGKVDETGTLKVCEQEGWHSVEACLSELFLMKCFVK